MIDLSIAPKYFSFIGNELYLWLLKGVLYSYTQKNQ